MEEHGWGWGTAGLREVNQLPCHDQDQGRLGSGRRMLTAGASSTGTGFTDMFLFAPLNNGKGSH